MLAQKKGPGRSPRAKRLGVSRLSPQEDHRSSLSQAIGRFEQARVRALSAADGITIAVEDQEILERLRCDPEDILIRADRVRRCATWMRARDFYEHGEYEIETSRCKQSHLCQPCAIVRGSRAMGAVVERVAVLKLQGRVLYVYLLTATVKDGSDLGERFRHLRGSFSKLLDARRGRGRNRGNALAALAGGLYSIEVKRGKGSGLWHPHLHAVVFSEEPLPVVLDARGKYRYPAFSDDWLRITGDSFITECHPVYAVTGSSDDFVTTDSSSAELMGAICEVCKYAVKFSSMEPVDLIDAWMTLRGRRMVESFGCFRGIKLEVEDDAFDFGHLAKPFIEYEYRWQRSGYSVTGWHFGNRGNVEPDADQESVLR